MIHKVSGAKNLSAASFEPTARPRKIVTIFIKEFCIVSERRSTAPDSFKKLPKHSAPTNGVASGSTKIHKINKVIGKNIFSI